LQEGQLAAPLTLQERLDDVQQHLSDLHNFYGDRLGVQMARKHTGWYAHGMPGAAAFRRTFNGLETSSAQMACVNHFFLQHLN
jgi:tRNA-dihydrouridine synthase B